MCPLTPPPETRVTESGVSRNIESATEIDSDYS